MAHTPGPWKVELVENGGYDCKTNAWFVSNSRGEPWPSAIARIDLAHYDPSQQVGEANARLIAAAPDLLAALKAHDAYMLAAGYEGPESDALHRNAAANWRNVRAAIAKAEGAK